MANLTPRLDRLERNQIHNGNFDLWQRGTSVSVGSGAKTFQADRWACARSAYTVTYARSTDVPSLIPNAKYSASLVTTGTSSATSRQCQLIYHFEGYDWSANIGKAVYLQFWAKASVIGTYGINLGFGGTEPTKFVQEFSITAVDTWQLVRILIPTVPLAAWELENGLGVRLGIIASLGSDFNTVGPVGSWSASHTGGGTAAIAANTFGSSASHTFKVAQVLMFAVDSNFTLATNVPSGADFLRVGRTIQEELTLCQRYFEKSYNLTVAPGTVTSEGEFFHQSGGSFSDPRWFKNVVHFKTAKRTIPTVTSYSPTTGASGQVSGAGPSTGTNTDGGQSIINTGETAFSNGDAIRIMNTIQFHWTADAEF